MPQGANFWRASVSVPAASTWEKTRPLASATLQTNSPIAVSLPQIKQLQGSGEELYVSPAATARIFNRRVIKVLRRVRGGLTARADPERTAIDRRRRWQCPFPVENGKECPVLADRISSWKIAFPW